MENIGKFLDACVAYGVPKTDLFQTVDLYEGQNIPQVSMCVCVCVLYACVCVLYACVHALCLCVCSMLVCVCSMLVCMLYACVCGRA